MRMCPLHSCFLLMVSRATMRNNFEQQHIAFGTTKSLLYNNSRRVLDTIGMAAWFMLVVVGSVSTTASQGYRSIEQTKSEYMIFDLG